MSLDEKFNKSAEDVRKLKSTPGQDDLLELYGYFKQGSIGDVNTGAKGVFTRRKRRVDESMYSKDSDASSITDPYADSGSSYCPSDLEQTSNESIDRPGMLDLKGKAKWDKWNSLKGLSQNEAKEKYIAKVETLIASIGLN